MTTGMVGAEHGAERADAGDAVLDAALVDVVAEDVDAVRAGQVEGDVAVEVADAHAVRRLEEAADRAAARRPAGGTGTARDSGSVNCRSEMPLGRGGGGRERPRGARGQLVGQSGEAGAPPLGDLERARRRRRRSGRARTRRTAPAGPAASTRRAWPCSDRCLARDNCRRWMTEVSIGERPSCARPSAATASTISVTNHIPRRLATRAMGWFSRVEQPLVARLSLAIWRAAAGDALRLDEADAHRLPQHPRLLHPRPEARGAARSIASAGIVVSPCDGIVVAAGRIADATLVQAKGFTYTLDDLLQDPALAATLPRRPLRHDPAHRRRCTTGSTRRMTAASTTVCHVPGDTWNVNPPALARVPRLYCRNERVIIPIDAGTSGVSRWCWCRSERSSSAACTCTSRAWPPAPATAATRRVRCQASFRRGEELGYFHHGSTIIVLAPPGLEPVAGVAEGVRSARGPTAPRTAASRADGGGVASSSMQRARPRSTPSRAAAARSSRGWGNRRARKTPQIVATVPTYCGCRNPGEGEPVAPVDRMPEAVPVEHASQRRA